jgi:hypothetical protein
VSLPKWHLLKLIILAKAGRAFQQRSWSSSAVGVPQKADVTGPCLTRPSAVEKSLADNGQRGKFAL